MMFRPAEKALLALTARHCSDLDSLLSGKGHELLYPQLSLRFQKQDVYVCVCVCVVSQHNKLFQPWSIRSVQCDGW